MPMKKQDKIIMKKGTYHNDYSPRYQKPYDIYKKAKNHMKDIKKNNKQSTDSL